MQYPIISSLPGPFGLGTQPNAFWTQANIWVDPLGTRGGNDNNDGLTALNPIQHWSEVIRRYGTIFPTLKQQTNFNFLTGSPTDMSDPVRFNPMLSNFGSARFNAFLDAHNLVGGGALAGVIVKNRGTGVFLQADLAAVPGAAVGMVLVNTTAGKASRCFVEKSMGGTVFQLTTPLTIIDNWPIGFGNPSPVDTYANGDTFQLYNQDLLDVVECVPRVAEFDAALSTEFTVFTNVGVLNPVAISNPMYLGDTTAFVYSRIQRRCFITLPVFNRNNLFFGCLGEGGARGGPVDVEGIGNLIYLIGGAWGSLDVQQGYLDADVILKNPSSRLKGGLIGSAFLDTGASLLISDEVQITDEGYGEGGQLWGPGDFDVKFGRLICTPNAVTVIKNTGTKKINGKTVAYNSTAAAPSVINGNVAITAANVDAATDSGLWVPGGGSISSFE